jgi:hypothetical protein
MTLKRNGNRTLGMIVGHARQGNAVLTIRATGREGVAVRQLTITVLWLGMISLSFSHPLTQVKGANLAYEPFELFSFMFYD